MRGKARRGCCTSTLWSQKKRQRKTQGPKPNVGAPRPTANCASRGVHSSPRSILPVGLLVLPLTEAPPVTHLFPTHTQKQGKGGGELSLTRSVLLPSLRYLLSIHMHPHTCARNPFVLKCIHETPGKKCRGSYYPCRRADILVAPFSICARRGVAGLGAYVPLAPSPPTPRAVRSGL